MAARIGDLGGWRMVNFTLRGICKKILSQDFAADAPRHGSGKLAASFARYHLSVMSDPPVYGNTAPPDHRAHRTALPPPFARGRKSHGAMTRMGLTGLGWGIMLMSPVIGLLPGPGFLILFPVGLAMVLRNSRWAKKRYVGFRRRWPAYGRWTDWALRRRGVRAMPSLPPLRQTVRLILRQILSALPRTRRKAVSADQQQG